MEIRTLRYFLESAREENMTRAAERLHVTQPTLSKQLKALEDELGQKLFTRHSSSIKLTAEGVLLRKRAEDILQIVDKTLDEFQSLDAECSGDIQIGCAESASMRYIAQVFKKIQTLHPRIRFHLRSGNLSDVQGDLDKGLSDFAVIVHEVDLMKYHYLTVPARDTWGAVLRRDHPLAQKQAITLADLRDEPLILSRQALTDDYPKWFGEELPRLNIKATFNLAYNGGILVREGMGIMITFDHLLDTSEDSELCFRPLEPKLESEMYIIWRNYQVFTPAAQVLLEELKRVFSAQQ